MKSDLENEKFPPTPSLHPGDKDVPPPRAKKKKKSRTVAPVWEDRLCLVRAR